MSFKSKLTLAFLSFVFSIAAHAQAEKMLFAVDVIRHGDRTPISDLPSTPYAWPQGSGQLTPTGMQQEFQLGTAMRKRYVEEAQLLPAHYQAETMYVRSSDFDRTLMSAEALLLGLYPLGSGPLLPNADSPALPSAYQPIPIHTIPIKQDSLLVQDSDPKLREQWLKEFVYTRPDWKKKTAELQPQFARWSQLTGIKITKLDQIISIGDNLLIRQLYKLPLPQGMTETEAKTIIEARHWAFATHFKALAFGQATGHKLLAAIAAYLHEASQSKSKLKFVLFSAHDSTILSLMSAMKAPLEVTPRYASDLSFVLVETEAGEKRVKVSLNGEDLVLPTCGGEACKLAQFESLAGNKT